MKKSNVIKKGIRLQFIVLILLPLVVLSVRAGNKEVVINEIMYHPPNDLEDLQYVELFNIGDSAVDISNWSISKGIDYTFPVGTQIAPGGYVVVCRELDAFAKIYGQKIEAYGNFGRRLSHKGEMLQLSDSEKNLIDAVKYADRDPWPVGADGYSSSLERVSPFAESQLADNWAASKLPNIRTPKGTPGRQNDNYSANLPPMIKDVDFSPKCPSPGQSVTVRANVSDSDGLKAVTLVYRVAKSGSESAETELAMRRLSDGSYEALIPGQAERHLVRFRIKAIDAKGTQRICPSENEPRRTFSYYVYADQERGNIPFGFVVHVGEEQYYETMREQNRELVDRMRRSMNLEGLCFYLMVLTELAPGQFEEIRNVYRSAFEKREELVRSVILTRMDDTDDQIQKFNEKLSDQHRQVLTDEQYAQFEKKKQAGRNQPPRRERRIFGRGRDDDERRRRELGRFFKNFMNVESAWTSLMVSIEDIPQRHVITAERLTDMKKIFRDAFDKREKLMQEAMSFDDPREQMQEMFMKVMEADATFAGKLHEFFNDEQSAKFDEWRSNQNPWMRRRGRDRDRLNRTSHLPAEPTRGNCVFVYVPAGGEPIEVFDHVRIERRKGGFKIRFHKDQTLRGMTTINVIFEYMPRFVLAEPLAYEVYRMAGVPAELTEHIRIWIDERLHGYYLSIEQPNKAFLRRNKRDDNGNLYKLLWYEEDIVQKHEKKTNTLTGHDDIVELINGLERTSGKEQWEFIKKHFNVDEFASYFAVNMCLSNWDGFFNNYFTYHDLDGTGKWEIYPWDEDKTWGFHDAIDPPYDFYDMPLTFGMNGDKPPKKGIFGLFSRRERNSMWGGPGTPAWWRPAGYFSGPMLANPYFRKIFLTRLKEICLTSFTEEKFFPIIDAMEKRLEQEIRIRAKAFNQDSSQDIRTFHKNMQSIRDQVTNRRKFILSQPEIKAVMR